MSTANQPNVALFTVIAAAFGRRRNDLIAIACYLLAVAAFFWQLLFLPDVSVPKGGGDLVSFLYPAYAFAAQNIQGGIVPLWNPYLFGGSPFAADVQSGLFYPPNMLAFLIARPFTYQAMEALAVAHYFLAACFTYLLARELGLSSLGAFAAGLIFAFGGFQAAHLAHLNMLAAATWLPLVLLLFHRAVSRRSPGWAAASGLAFGVAILAGHTQISLYTGFFLVLYYSWSLFGCLPRTGWRLRSLAIPAISFAVAGATAAVQLLPLVELLQRSLRAGLSYARALEFAASPLGLITLVVPHFFGATPAEYWGLRWSLGEVYGYAGIFTLLLAALTLWVRRPRQPAILFFTLAALLALFLSLGEHTALYGWLYRFVPGFDKVRAAGRFLMIFDLALAIVAAYGVAMLETPLRARWRPAYHGLLRSSAIALALGALVAGPIFYFALLTSQDKDPAIFRRVAQALDSFNLSILFLLLGLLLLVLYRWRYRRSLAYLAVGLLALDLFSANAVLNPTTEDVQKGFQHPELTRYLQSAGVTRIDTATGVADIWQPGAAMLYGLSDTLGLFNPMTLADYQRYWENLGSRTAPGYDLLNAGYLVGRKDVALDREKFQLAFDGDPVLNVYRNTRALPRAFIVGAALVVPRDEQLARLRSLGFDPTQIVMLDQPVEDARAVGGGRVLAIRYDNPNEVSLLVDNPQPGYLVLADAYYPGWHASVDGRETPVLRANYTFRALLLPAGAREVRLAFRPTLWYLGLAISIATLSALGGWCLIRWRISAASPR